MCIYIYIHIYICIYIFIYAYVNELLWVNSLCPSSSGHDFATHTAHAGHDDVSGFRAIPVEKFAT